MHEVQFGCFWPDIFWLQAWSRMHVVIMSLKSLSKDTGEVKFGRHSCVVAQSRADGEKPPADAGKELGLVDTLELSLFLFSVEAGAAIRTLATELYVVWPAAVG